MAISLHNSVVGTPSSTLTLTATGLTASIGEIIVVTINHESVSGAVPTVLVVTDGTTNVYTKRFAASQAPEPQFGASEGIEVWWAYAANALVAATVIVTMSNAIDDAVVIAAGYQGFTGTAYQTAPWDANASLPKTAQSALAAPSTPTVTGLSTTSTAGMLLAGVVTCGGNGVMSPPTGYTQVQQAQNTGASNQVRGVLFNKVYSSINSSITVATGSGDEGWIFYVDALTDQGSAPPVAPPFVPNPDPNSHVVAAARAKVVAVALTAGAVWVPFAPTNPSNTVPAGWYQPLSIAPPVAKAQPGSSFVPFNTPQPAPAVPYGWLSIASSPPPLVAAQPGYSSVPFNTRQTNTATIDKWQQPLATPVLAPQAQPGSSFVPFNTPQFVITPPWGWHEPLSTPSPVAQAQLGAFFVPFNTAQFFPPPPWGWYQSLAATPSAASAIQSQPQWSPSAFPTFTLAWQQPLAATPARYAAQQGILSLPFFVAPIANTVVGMPWQQPLSIPLKVAQAIQGNTFVPFNTVQAIITTTLIQRTLTGVGL